MFGYISTRGEAPRLNFSDVTLAGLASDGGLYVPESCPILTAEDLANMKNQSYVEIAYRILLPFVGDDIPAGELVRLLKDSYKNFNHPEIAPLRTLDDNFYLQELFHGPTLAFKDVALQFLGPLFDAILAKKKQRVTIVGATSGDTGSAAIDAFKNKENADIFILHPHTRVSEVQRRQMTTVEAPNVFNIAIEGSFDDCQDLVKGLFNDTKFRAEMNLSAVNSINWARILAQVVYYVYTASRVGKPIAFCVPTGNFGNVYAGYIARSIGVPVEKLIVATNRNDILHRFLQTGKMAAEGVTPSLSPSMDIQISSNFERLLFDLYGRDGTPVRKTMEHFRKTGPYQLDDGLMARLRLLFTSGRQDDAQTLTVMEKTHREKNILLDPHTAVGVGVAEDYRKKNPGSVIVSLATAHPAKFPDAVKRATGVMPELPEALADLHSRREKYDVLPADAVRLQDFVRARVRR